MLRRKAELLQKIHSGAGVTELVVDADAAHGSGQLLAEQAADSLAQTADDGVLLAGDNLTALSGGGEDQLLIEGPSKSLVASVPTLGISRVNSSTPRFVSRTSSVYSSTCTEVKISSLTTRSEITIASS